MIGVLVGVLGAAAAGCFWVVVASAVYCRLSSHMDLFVFPFDQWLEIAPDWKVTGWTQAFVVISALVASAPFGLALVVLRFRGRGRQRLVRRGGVLRPIEAGVTDNLGHARWAMSSEIATRFTGPSGCLIGAADRRVDAPLLFDDMATGPGHSMIFAGPGSDKTTTAVTRIWNWRGSRVVFDPSLEIGPIMIRALQAEGFKVITIGLTGQGVNALDWIDTKHPEADAHIRSAVDWIYNEGAANRSGGNQGRDPFWATWGRSLVTCLMADMLYEERPIGPKTLAALRTGIATPEGDMPELLKGINKMSSSRMARDLAGGLMGMKAPETFSGIYSNAFAGTEWMSVGAYADVVSGNAMKTSDILDSNTVVFIQLPLRTLLATPAVGRAVIGALFNAMFHADGSGIQDRILFQLDEAWILGAMKEIKLCHTTARKYRGAVSTIWQSEGQMEGVWGRDDAKLMRDTVSWRSYNAIQDGDVAEKLSRDLGEHAVLAYSEGDNQGMQKPFGLNFGSSSRGTNLNVHEVKRRLIKSDEIMRAPADEMFVLARDFPYPVKCVSAPYHRYSALAGRMNSNRFVNVE